MTVGPLLRLFSPIVPRVGGGPRHHFVHAEDVARALLFALQEERTKHAIFNVADDDPLPLGERIGLTFDAYGIRSARIGQLPGFVASFARASARTPGTLRALDLSVLTLWRSVVARHGLKPALRPRLDREAVTLFDNELLIDSGRLRALGFQLRHPRFSAGWAETLRWYQAENWVPRY